MSKLHSSRNINLGYSLIGIANAYFWYAPWLLFVYQFIDIRQATILELIGLLTRVVTEIPTGALSDLLGKKKSLIISFVLTALGEITMSLSTDFGGFAVAYIIMNFGYSFYSGTIDAFMYDSLLENKEEEYYPKVLSRGNAIMNASTAFATITGGFLYAVWGGLPFLATGIAKIIGLIVAFFVVEPKIDTIVFSFKNFVKQTSLGVKHLFGKEMLKWTLLLMILGSFSTVAFEILDDVSVVDWGYSAQGISFLYTTVILLSIPSSFLYERFAKKFSSEKILVGGILILVLNYIFSLWINVFVWTVLFLVRVIYSPLKKAAITDVINQNSSSAIRATTLSTYELIIRIPFLLFGVLIAASMKEDGVRNFSVIFSSLLLALTVTYLLSMRIFAKTDALVKSIDK